MAEIVGIRFKRAGRVYYFEPAGIDLEVNDYVVVKTARGLELGQVVIAPKQVLSGEVARPLKSVVRKAEPEDVERALIVIRNRDRLRLHVGHGGSVGQDQREAAGFAGSGRVRERESVCARVHRRGYHVSGG